MVRLQQTLIVLAGLVVAAGMVVLGLWQLSVYQASGSQTAEERATAAPVPLTQAAPPATKITDGFGRAVAFAGSYDPGLQQTVPIADSPGRFRVLTGFRLDDGRLLAVVRGTTAGAAPAPPSGHLEQAGVLLPSESSDDPSTSVRVPLLAQDWPGDLVEGYVNLNSELSVAQGLAPAPLDLPATPGRFRNGAYALQWWLFAGFAVVMAGRMARDLDRSRDLDLLASADETEDVQPDAAPSATPGAPDEEHLPAT